MKRKIGKLGLHSTGYWHCNLDGKRHYFKPAGITREEAERQYRLLQLEEQVSQTGELDCNVVPVKDLIDLYLDRTKKDCGESLGELRQRYLLRFSNKFGHLLPSQIKSRLVDDWISEIPCQTTGGGKSLVHNVLTTCFRWLEAKEGIAANPMKASKKWKAKPRGIVWIFTPDEWLKTLPLIHQPYRDAFHLMYLTGCRPKEILDAQISEFDSNKKLLDKFRHKNEKKDKSRLVILNDEAASIIQERIGTRTQGNILVQKNGKPLGLNYTTQLLKKRAKAAGRIKPCCSYSMRHSFVVRNLEAGHSLETVATWIGDTPATVARHYAHFIERLRTNQQTVRPA